MQMTQDQYIADLVKDKADVNVYLMNGIKLRGTIVGFDNYAVFVTNSATVSNGAQMVYKHAISTVSRI